MHDGHDVSFFFLLLCRRRRSQQQLSVSEKIVVARCVFVTQRDTARSLVM
jgi:hypothetical protein